MPKRLIAVLVGLLVAAATPAQTPLGPQFLVNSYTTNLQSFPSVAIDADGDFVVVWRSTGSDGGDIHASSVQGRRFSSAGSPLGAQFQVNSYTTGSQSSPVVAVAPDGDFVVIWGSFGSDNGDTSPPSLEGQRYSSAGISQGLQFLVNSYTTDTQRTPAVAIDADGDFVVVWNSYGSVGDDSMSYSVQGQRFSSAGSLLGSQFQVNSYTTGGQYFPAVATDPAGDFVVVWQSYGSYGADDSLTSIQGQRYSAAGVAQGDQFQVNSYSTHRQERPGVATDAAGDFVVIWSSYGSDNGDNSEWSIQGQRYSSDGDVLGSQFLVNSYTTLSQGYPSVTGAQDGGFFVVWQSEGSEDGDSSLTSVQARLYASDGAPHGDQFQVNSYTTNQQRNAAVAMDSAGHLVVVWESNGSDNGDSSLTSIQGQRLGTEIFADGFESGDASAWSGAVP